MISFFSAAFSGDGTGLTCAFVSRMLSTLGDMVLVSEASDFVWEFLIDVFG